MNSIPSESKSKDRNIQCGICGHWLSQYEYGGLIRGNFVHFNDKRVGDLIIPTCSECLTKILELCTDD